MLFACGNQEVAGTFGWAWLRLTARLILHVPLIVRPLCAACIGTFFGMGGLALGESLLRSMCTAPLSTNTTDAGGIDETEWQISLPLNQTNSSYMAEACDEMQWWLQDHALLFVGSFGALSALLYAAPAAPFGAIRPSRVSACERVRTRTLPPRVRAQVSRKTRSPATSSRSASRSPCTACTWISGSRRSIRYLLAVSRNVRLFREREALHIPRNLKLSPNRDLEPDHPRRCSRRPSRLGRCCS